MKTEQSVPSRRTRRVRFSLYSYIVPGCLFESINSRNTIGKMSKTNNRFITQNPVLSFAWRLWSPSEGDRSFPSFPGWREGCGEGGNSRPVQNPPSTTSPLRRDCIATFLREHHPLSPSHPPSRNNTRQSRQHSITTAIMNPQMYAITHYRRAWRNHRTDQAMQHQPRDHPCDDAGQQEDSLRRPFRP